MGNRWRFPRTRRAATIRGMKGPDSFIIDDPSVSLGSRVQDAWPALVGKPVPYEPLEDQTPLGTYCSCPPEGQEWVTVRNAAERAVRSWCATCGMDVDPADLDP